MPSLPREEDLLDTLAALEKARNRFLERLRAFERKRIREKLRGRRRPLLSDVAALYAPPGERSDPGDPVPSKNGRPCPPAGG